MRKPLTILAASINIIFKDKPMSTTIEIPKEIYEILRQEARKRGRTIEDLIIDLILKTADPPARIKAYKKLHEKYLEEAQKYLRKGDLVQASEKYWGAVTALLNAIGEKEGLPHYTHRDLKEISLYLTKKKKDPEYTRLFSSTETLHANYYHNFLDEETFNIHKEDAEKLIQKIKELLK